MHPPQALLDRNACTWTIILQPYIIYNFVVQWFLALSPKQSIYHWLSLSAISSQTCAETFFSVFSSVVYGKNLYFQEICLRIQTNTGNTSTELEMELEPIKEAGGRMHIISRKFHQPEAKPAGEEGEDVEAPQGMQDTITI